MSPKETLAVLKMVQAALPGAYLDERTPDVWVNACATVPADVGAVAVQRLIAGCSSTGRFPSPADFLTYVRAVKREREPVGLPESTEPALTREEHQAQIAEARRLLNEAGSAPRPTPHTIPTPRLPDDSALSGVASYKEVYGGR